jgi:hypothetical protein
MSESMLITCAIIYFSGCKEVQFYIMLLLKIAFLEINIGEYEKEEDKRGGRQKKETGGIWLYSGI